MLDIGFQELAVIMVLALLIFGPDRLPELGRRLGRALREFRRASDDFRTTVEQNLQINADISPPSFDPAPATAADAPAGGTASSGGEPTAAPVDGDAEGQGATEPLEPFWASRGGRLLHRRECAWRGRIPESERIPLKTALDGWEQGLKPCPVCDPPASDPPAPDPKEAEIPS
jgi:TatA/E family protein of Tat protein translocase